jgi:hypothetical protein
MEDNYYGLSKIISHNLLGQAKESHEKALVRTGLLSSLTRIIPEMFQL